MLTIASNVILKCTLEGGEADKESLFTSFPFLITI